MLMKKLFSRIASNSLARDSAIVFAGSMAANIGSYIYHLLMGRLLGPAGYGELSSLFSLLYIFTVPLVVGQTVLVKFISGFKAHGEVGQAKSLFLSVTKLCIVICIIGLPLVLLCSPLVTSFLHLSSTALLTLIYLLFAFSLLTVATASMIQGYQKFFWFSIFSAGAIIIKVILSIPFVQWGVLGVLVAATIASVIMYLLYFLPLRFVLTSKSKPTNLTKREAVTFAVPTLLTLLGTTSIYSTDIILVRHYFAANEAGFYAALAILGKIIFYASSSVALVLFPVLSEQTAKGAASKKLITSAIGAVAIVSLGLALLYFLFPDMIVSLLFGNAYRGAGVLLGLFGSFIALYSVGYIISTICLALGKTGIWIVPASCALIQIVAITIFHGSISTVIVLNIAVSVLLVVGTLGYYLARAYEKI
ncbi:hypothetical protein A2Z00_02500 [Candidatus Gottesmanbacteria bacterium RBG_13_45_10]|uniref:Polysaccharide biosynthesis protein C-terminal domain-containing protein n=1 Tax=Candidatus Gottesmanbacteria bacterium RBG_13_45_10 TaxID=1798370 RepID=A0A1F5ZGR2_9BACT|nr:MAG: hypothetical protein A2Z00_02500 [Candidatus Gottesmanbacteria bacterium RBG_13_45_10]